MSNGIKRIISDTIFVGIPTKQYNDLPPLSKIVPVTKNSNHKSRISKIKNSKAFNTIKGGEVVNDPVAGFQIEQKLNGVDEWIISDPRGFHVLVPGENLLEIIQNSTIDKNEIVGKCVWTSTYGKHYLINVNSEEYKRARELTDIASKSASMRDLKPGYDIKLQNGIEGTYIGKLHCIYYYSYKWSGSNPKLINSIDISSPKQHAMNVLDKDSGDHNMTMYTTIKPSEITKTTQLTEAEIEQHVNDAISIRKLCGYGRSRYYRAIAATIQEPDYKNLKLFVDEVNLGTMDISKYYETEGYPLLIAKLTTGDFGVYSNGHTYGYADLSLLEPDVLATNDPTYMVSQYTHPTHSIGVENRINRVRVPVSDITNVYRVTVQVTTEHHKFERIL